MLCSFPKPAENITSLINKNCGLPSMQKDINNNGYALTLLFFHKV
jgi:hypothetical protein